MQRLILLLSGAYLLDPKNVKLAPTSEIWISACCWAFKRIGPQKPLAGLGDSSFWCGGEGKTKTFAIQRLLPDCRASWEMLDCRDSGASNLHF